MVLFLYLLYGFSLIYTVSCSWCTEITPSGEWRPKSKTTISDIEISFIDKRTLRIPLLLHRSHRYSWQSLQSAQSEAEARVKRNIDSCTEVNEDVTQWYYDDDQVNQVMKGPILELLKTENPKAADVFEKAWLKLDNDPVLKQIFVLKVDIFRLAIVWFYGGWWLDADALCLDDIGETLRSRAIVDEIDAAYDRWQTWVSSHSCTLNVNENPNLTDRESESIGKDGTVGVGCVWAWEGEVKKAGDEGPSSPLNWAFGCAARHPLLLEMLKTASKNVLSWNVNTPVKARLQEFSARVYVKKNGNKQMKKQIVFVDVVHMTGPALVERVMEAFVFGDESENAKNTGGLAALRRDVAGEDPKSSQQITWDRALLIPFQKSAKLNANAKSTSPYEAEAVLVLPYCFFRSRGCSHLMQRFQDKVIFHHEFDTDWRPSHWHSYHI